MRSPTATPISSSGRPWFADGKTSLCDTSLNPDWVNWIDKKFLDFYVEDFTRCLKATRGRIDIFWALTDLGTQAGLLQSRETFHRFIAPPIRTLAELANRHGVKFMFHSCGAVRELVPDLIELGVDILNPIQPAAAGMAPDGLKRDFGTKLCFHGGIDIQYLLPLESAAAVRAEARRRMEIWARAAATSSPRRTTCNKTFPRKTSVPCMLSICGPPGPPCKDRRENSRLSLRESSATFLVAFRSAKAAPLS